VAMTTAQQVCREGVSTGPKTRQRIGVARASRCARSIIGRDVAALDPDAFFAELSLAPETDAGTRAPGRLKTPAPSATGTS
jgi:hypothetical protein